MSLNKFDINIFLEWMEFLEEIFPMRLEQNKMFILFTSISHVNSWVCLKTCFSFSSQKILVRVPNTFKPPSMSIQNLCLQCNTFLLILGDHT